MANRDSEIVTLKVQLKDETEFKLDFNEKLEKTTKEFMALKESQDGHLEKNAFLEI